MCEYVCMESIICIGSIALTGFSIMIQSHVHAYTFAFKNEINHIFWTSLTELRLSNVELLFVFRSRSHSRLRFSLLKYQVFNVRVLYSLDIVVHHENDINFESNTMFNSIFDWTIVKEIRTNDPFAKNEKKSGFVS